MTVTTVDDPTCPEGTLVIHADGVLDATDTIELRRCVVRAIRHARPQRLVVDLAEVRELDPINLGTLATACDLGDDHQVAVFLHHRSAELADLLTAAGVPRHRLRHVP